MQTRLRPFYNRPIAFLFVLFLFSGPAFPQVNPFDYAAKYHGIEGIYEVRIPDAGTTVMEIYFKDGSLRTLDSGDSSSTKFDPVEGQELQFTRVSPEERAVSTRVPQGRARPLHEVPGHQ